MGLAKHRQLKYLLREKIESGKIPAHQLLPSERDLAQEHAVSLDTIRSALRELIAEGLIYRIVRKGTFVAPPAKKHQLLVVSKNPFHLHAWDTTVIPFFLGVQEEAWTHHRTAFPMLADSMRFLEELKDIDLVYRDLSGVIFYRDLEVLLSAKKILEEKEIPYMFYGSDAHGEVLSPIHRMTYAEETITDLALSHLESSGCRKFGFLGSGNWVVQRRRLELYKTWLSRRGYPFENETVKIVRDTQERPEEEQEMLRCFEGLRGKGYGIFAAGDCYAIRFMNAGLRGGWKFPEDFSVVGIDNVPTSAFLPVPLSSVDLSVQSDGGRCLKYLLEGGGTQRKLIVEKSSPFLVPRSSVATLLPS